MMIIKYDDCQNYDDQGGGDADGDDIKNHHNHDIKASNHYNVDIIDDQFYNSCLNVWRESICIFMQAMSFITLLS